MVVCIENKNRNGSINEVKNQVYDKTTSPRFRSARFFITALFGKEFHLNL